MARWTVEERTVIFILATEYPIDWAVFHRIWLRIWNRPVKKQQVRDEYRQRFAGGKSMMWARDIDTRPHPFTAVQLQRMATAGQQIIQAAQDLGITLVPLAAGANPGPAAPPAGLPPTGGAPPPVVPPPVAPLPVSRPPVNPPPVIPPPPAAGPSRPQNQPEKRKDPLGAYEKGQKKQKTGGKAPAERNGDAGEQGTRTGEEVEANHADTVPAARKPPSPTYSAYPEMVEVTIEGSETTRPLRMLHRCELTEAPRFPIWDEGNGNTVGPVRMRSPLYRLGGPVRRIGTKTGKVFDAMICPAPFCKYCSGELKSQFKQPDGQATVAENDEKLRKCTSAYKGKPFVHLLRDTTSRMSIPIPRDGEDANEDENEVDIFSPHGPWTSPPDQTEDREIAFEDRQLDAFGCPGQIGFREALVCIPRECDTCIKWSLDNAPALLMVHTVDVDFQDPMQPTWEQTGLVGYIPQDSFLYQYGGPVVKIGVKKDEGIKNADMMVCERSICSYCTSMPKGKSKVTDVEKALADAPNNPLIDVSSSPYSMMGEEHGHPFVHALRDTPETIMGREFFPRGPLSRVVTRVVAGAVLFDDKDLGRKNGRQLIRGLRHAALCDPGHCAVCKAWKATRAQEQEVEDEEGEDAVEVEDEDEEMGEK